MASQPIVPEPLDHVCIALHMVGCVGAIIILLTALVSSKVRRHWTWYNFFFSWIVYCISYTLLTLAGQERVNPNPTLCLLQAAIACATPSLTACTTLALVIQLWLNISAMLRNPKARHEHFTIVMLLAMPYVIAMAVFIGALSVGVRYPDTVVLSTGLHCGLENKTPRSVSSCIIIVAMLISTIAEIDVGIAFYRNYRGFQKLDGRVLGFLSTTIRLSVFTVFIISSLGTSAAFLTDFRGGKDSESDRGPDIILALTPVAAIVVFGTQSDIWNAWMFWKKQPRAEEMTLKSAASDIESKS